MTNKHMKRSSPSTASSNENSNSETSPSTYQDGQSRVPMTSNAGEAVGTQELSFTAGGLQNCAAPLKNYLTGVCVYFCFGFFFLIKLTFTI